MSLQGVLFAQACKKTCNLCNIQQTTTLISSLGCQNLQGFDSTCNYFTQAQFNNFYCTSNQAFVHGVLFSVACKKSCKLCNVQPTISTIGQCQNLPGLDASCINFSRPPWNACTNSFVSLQGVLFSVACKKTCNLC